MTQNQEKKLDLLLSYFEALSPKQQGSFIGDAIVFNPTSAANRLGISTKTLYKLRKEGLIEFSKAGRKIYISETQILAFIEKTKVK